jgi:hypothetical protein
MIISHSRKFVFIKSRKTAGTSLEAALSNQCGGDDVVTPLGDFDFNRDETGQWVHRAMNHGGYQQHDPAIAIRDRLGEPRWSDYFKFSIARNPWDRVVSLFTWRTRNGPATRPGAAAAGGAPGQGEDLGEIRRRFAEYVRGDWETNDAFYVIDGRLCVDFVIRYEQLATDVLEICRRIGIAPIELPRLKTGFRPGKYRYADYYDDATRAIVAERHANDIRFFGYRFERAGQ